MSAHVVETHLPSLFTRQGRPCVSFAVPCAVHAFFFSTCQDTGGAWRARPALVTTLGVDQKARSPSQILVTNSRERGEHWEQHRRLFRHVFRHLVRCGAGPLHGTTASC